MKIAPCILILSLIRKNEVIGEIVYDLLKFKPLMDKLESIFDEQEGLQNDITCNKLNFLSCYEKLLDVYENSIQYKVVEVIENRTVQKLEDYNKLVVSSFISTSEYQKQNCEENENNIMKNTIDVVSLKNSNMYCVIDFLKMFNRNLNIVMKDYVFFGDHEMLRVKNMKKFITLINSRFKNRRRHQSPSLDESIAPKSKNDDIISQKQRIDDFSTPFCNIGLPRMSVDSWMWKKLQNSFLLSQKMHNSISLMDWQDLKVLEFGKDIYTVL